MQGTNESFGPGNVRVKPNRQNTPVSSYDGVTSLCRYSSESEVFVYVKGVGKDALCDTQ